MFQEYHTCTEKLLIVVAFQDCDAHWASQSWNGAVNIFIVFVFQKYHADAAIMLIVLAFLDYQTCTVIYSLFMYSKTVIP